MDVVSELAINEGGEKSSERTRFYCNDTKLYAYKYCFLTYIGA